MMNKLNKVYRSIRCPAERTKVERVLGLPRTIQSKRFAAGDTLIEVIFAFAILGTIIGFAFTGVIQARRSAVAAQQRTQALEIAQYQSEALQTYRNSMDWDSSQGCPSFLDGVSGGCGGNAISLNTAAGNTDRYCMFPNGNIWQIGNVNQSSVAQTCANLVPNLRLNSGRPPVQIRFSEIGRLQASGTTTVNNSGDSVQATITVAWTDPFGHDQNVQNIVILTRQK